MIEARQKIRSLIDDTDPVEAPTAYYALFHPIEKSELFVRQQADGQVVGFVGRLQTGADLFRPLVTLKCNSPEIAADLLSEALVVGRPYILFASLNQLAMVGGSLRVENERILRIYAADPRRFQPEVNIMVQQNRAEDGTPRCVVKAGDEVVASAGVNWKSPGFAEIYVFTEQAARQRGWGRSVVSCLTNALLKEGVRPVYLVENSNEASKQLVESLGYYDTGSRHVYADTVYTGHPV